MTREKTLGVLLGLAAGLLVDSCLVVVAYLLLILVFPLLIVSPLVGIVSGLSLARAGLLPRLPWLLIVPIGVTALSLAILTPYELSVLELRWQGRAIPTLPDSTLLVTRTGPLGSSMAGPSVTKIFDTGIKAGEVVPFYRAQLVANGWKAVSVGQGRARFTGDGGHTFVTVSQRSNNTRVVVTYNLDFVKAPWLVLFVAVAGMFYVRHRYRLRTLR